MQENEGSIIAANLAAERASDELRRQLGLILRTDDGLVAVLPVEHCDEQQLAALKKSGSLELIITPTRASQINISEQNKPVSIEARALSLAQLQHISDPLAASVTLPELSIKTLEEACGFSLLLAKQAALLPALLIAKITETPELFANWQTFCLSDLKLAMRRPLLEALPVADANLPIHDAENTRLYSFRSRFGTSVHLALVVGNPGEHTPLVRVHSSCVTGDILGSMRCDCGDQLRLALEAIKKDGNGILIYLHQEGRGIGISSKLRAYQLQERGIDTYDANLALGFEIDERDFSLAASILKQLGAPRIRLLTNNPDKITALKALGIVVESRVGLAIPAGKHNHDYLRTKADKSGHLL